MSTEKRQFPQGEFLRQFNETGKIDRKNAARVFNEARDPYLQKGLREQRMQNISRILEEARSQPKPQILTAADSVRVLERAAEQGKQYTAELDRKPLESTVSPDEKQAITEIRDTLNQKTERMRELIGNLTGTLLKFPKNERELVSLIVQQMADRELNKMSDEGKTEEAVNLIDDKEGMLRLRNEKAKQLLEERNARTAQAEQEKEEKNTEELPDQTDKAPNPNKSEQLPEEVTPNTNPEPETATPKELSPDAKKAVSETEAPKPVELTPKKEADRKEAEKKSKEKTFGERIKRGFRAIKKFVKAVLKNPTARGIAIGLGLGVVGTLGAWAWAQHAGKFLPYIDIHLKDLFINTSNPIQYLGK